jgi:hypothetical protein
MDIPELSILSVRIGFYGMQSGDGANCRGKGKEKGAGKTDPLISFSNQ